MPTTRKADPSASCEGGRQIARAKINLALHVTGRRQTGYHSLDSVVTFTRYGDRLRFAPANEVSLSICGPFANGIDHSDNSVLQAAKKLRLLAGSSYGAAISLEKNLPIASGIGGGSADAAAVISGLCGLWNLNPDKNELKRLALDLGADVPMCLAGRSARITGIGEAIEPLSIPSFPMVLINPRIPLSTPEVFVRLKKPSNNRINLAVDTKGIDAWLKALAGMRNDLTAPAVDLVPEIGHCLDALERTPSCRLARMSGSGATCFGIFANDASAREAASRFSRDHPEWWSIATRSIT